MKRRVFPKTTPFHIDLKKKTKEGPNGAVLNGTVPLSSSSPNVQHGKKVCLIIRHCHVPHAGLLNPRCPAPHDALLNPLSCSPRCPAQPMQPRSLCPPIKEEERPKRERRENERERRKRSNKRKITKEQNKPGKKKGTREKGDRKGREVEREKRERRERKERIPGGSFFEQRENEIERGGKKSGKFETEGGAQTHQYCQGSSFFSSSFFTHVAAP